MLRKFLVLAAAATLVLAAPACGDDSDMVDRGDAAQTLVDEDSGAIEEVIAAADDGDVSLATGEPEEFCDQVREVRTELGLDEPDSSFTVDGFLDAVVALSEMTPPEPIHDELEAIVATYAEVAEIYRDLPELDRETIAGLPEEDQETLSGLARVQPEVAVVDAYAVQECGIGLTAAPGE